MRRLGAATLFAVLASPVPTGGQDHAEDLKSLADALLHAKTACSLLPKDLSTARHAGLAESAFAAEALQRTCLQLSGEPPFHVESELARGSEGSLPPRGLTSQADAQDGGDSNPTSPPISVVNIPYFADAAHAYPLPLLLTFVGVLAVLVFFWEVAFLKSTLFGLRGKKTWETLKSLADTMQGYVSGFVFDTEMHELKVDRQVGRKTTLFEDEWMEAELFWKKIESDALVPIDLAKVDPNTDIVGFANREFKGREADGQARISLVRSGPAKERVEVSVSIRETSYNTHFKAVAGKEFEAMDEKIVVFEPGTRVQHFHVRIYKDTGGWQPSRYFVAQINSAAPESVIVGGPTCMRKQNQGGPMARVFIAQACNFPQEHNDFPRTTLGDIKLVWTYFMERKKDRGWKWWKTLISLLYEPVHGIVVMTCAEKFLLDYACVPHPGKFNNYWAIVGAGLAITLSLVILRWANQCATKNRGRTGGCRMKHRVDLFSKLMNLDHEDQMKYPSVRWLYTALEDVDILVSSGYWQSFMMIQNIFALFLALLVLFMAELYKTLAKDDHHFHVETFLDSIGILVITPITLFFLWRRESQTSKHLEQRAQLEQYWVDNLANLSRNAQQIYAIGARDLMSLEADFEKESSVFVKHHQAARDYMEDTYWIPKWLSHLTYVFIAIYAGFRLYQSNAEDNKEMTAGDLVLVLKVYSQFGKYIAKVSSSVVGLMKAAVALRRISELLDEKELSHLDTTVGDMEVVSLDPRHARRIVFDRPVMPLRGENRDLRMKEGASLELSLGSMVRVERGTISENGVEAFLKHVALVLHPRKGQIVVETSGLALLCMVEPFEVRHNTVASRLLFSGMHTAVAFRAAKAIGLDPDRRCSTLTTPEKKMLELFLALMRDPEVLVLDRPLALLTGTQRTRFASLLRLWQTQGGAVAIMNHLTAGLLEPKEVMPLLAQRTLIYSDTDMQEAGLDHVVVLSDFFEEEENTDKFKVVQSV